MEWELLKEVQIVIAIIVDLSSFLFPVPVPCVEDQPHPQVGGSVERAWLPGTDCIFCCQGGERALPQVVTIGTFSLCFAVDVCQFVPVNVMHGVSFFFLSVLFIVEVMFLMMVEGNQYS